MKPDRLTSRGGRSQVELDCRIRLADSPGKKNEDELFTFPAFPRKTLDKLLLVYPYGLFKPSQAYISMLRTAQG